MRGISIRFICCACVFIATSSKAAMAAPTGAVGVDETILAADAAGLRTCNVYVVFENPTDVLISIGFSHIATDDPAGFFQAPQGGNLPTNPAFCEFFPSVCYDSFVTIGSKTSSANLSLDPDFCNGSFNCTCGATPPSTCCPGAAGIDPLTNCGETSGGWFATPVVPPLGTPDALHVLVGRFTVRKMVVSPPLTPNVSGSFRVFYTEAGTGVVGADVAFDCFAAEPECVTGADCPDGNPCTDDVCNAGVCSNPNLPVDTACGINSNTDCDNPDTCNGNGVCQNNNEPNDTPCTSDSNACTADFCDAGLCTHPNLSAGTACGINSNTVCDNPDTCNGSGVCQDNNEPNDTPCTSDSNACTADFCDAGLCTHPNLAAGTACGSNSDTDCDNPDTCNASGACQINNEPDDTACNDGVFCNGSDTCNGGACQHSGDPCAGGAVCNNSCNEGADNCLSPAGTACGSNANTECDNPDTCNGSGSCSANNEPAGTACGGAANTDCDNPDTCNGSGACQQNNEPNGTGCTTDGNDCTDDVCQTGVCTHSNSQTGTSCTGNGAGPCSNADTCNGSGACSNNDLMNGTGCTSDGNDCTNDVCSAGACTHPNSTAGSPCGSSANTDCDNPNTCNGSGSCSPNNEPNGTGCTSDANDCTSDVCSGGTCMHPNLPDGTQCPDGAFCTGVDTCNNGTCIHPGDPCPAGQCCNEATDQCGGTACKSDGECNDNNPCTTDTCSAGCCAHAPVTNSTPCPDGLFCNGADTCNGGICQHAGDPCVGGATCNNMCSETADNCLSPNSTPCGNAADTECDNPDTCNGAGMCVMNQESNDASCTSDGNSCTNDICTNGVCTHPGSPEGTPCGSNANTECDNPNTCDGSGSCQPNNEPNGTSCSDGNACTSGDSCQGGSCAAGGPNDCDDGQACTTDTCTPPTGCLHTDIVCDTGQVCVDGACIMPPQCGVNLPPCNDQSACTTDACVNGSCMYTAISCNDGNACTTDSCNPATGCSNTQVDCNDGNACTTDSCNPASGCVHAQVNCDDGNACTTDSCNSMSGCVYGQVSCSAVPCMIAMCDPASGCVYSPLCQPDQSCVDGKCVGDEGCTANDVCDDFDACTFDECTAAGICANTPINCDDGNLCTNDGCSFATGCTHSPADCDDQDPCTTDSCYPASGCSNEPVICDEGEVCEEGECVPEADGVIATLDIKGGACPGPVSPNGSGLVGIVLAGDTGFPAKDAVRSSLQLRRCDGIGGFVSPIADHTKVKHSARPFPGQVVCDGGCACSSNQSPDGILDLDMKFKTSDMKAAGFFSGGQDGQIITLELTGELPDGTAFTARDCIVLDY